MRTATYSSHWPRPDAFSKHQKNRLSVAVVNEDGGKLKATWKWGLEESAEVRMIPRQSKGIQEIIRSFGVQLNTTLYLRDARPRLPPKLMSYEV
ncbi:hypothetical protein [Alcaligenes sp.]|uniref:hypothetical protein n=1 Tax=Alcaligenes sp. TaxID=512 RepID=UPI003D082031